MSKRADGDGETTYEYSVEGRLAAVKAGGRTLMAATYDGDGNRIMQASPYHEDVPGTEGSALDGGAGDEGAADEGLSLWSIGLFWYGFAAGGAAALAAANPAAMAASVEVACALVEATWPEGAFDSAASDYALSHLGLPAFDLAAMTGSYGVGEPARTDELLDVVTYTNSSVVGDVAQVASSHSTRSGESSEVYGLDRLSKSEGGSATAYAYDGRGSVAQTLSSSGAASSWHVWGAFGEQEAGSALGELPSYGFNGEETHPQTGLQYLRARYYDTGTGRFGVQDSYLGQTSDPLSLNRYLYCLSDPLNLIDPSGYSPQWTRLYNPFTVSTADRVRIMMASAGVPKGGQIYVTVPIGVWKVTETMAWLTTYAGIANWKAIEAQRPGYVPPAGFANSQSYADWCRQKALQLKLEVERVYCGSAEELADYRQEKRAQRAAEMEIIHRCLDVAGLVVPVFDALNALYYVAEDNWTEAGLSTASMIYGVDWFIFGGKMVRLGSKSDGLTATSVKVTSANQMQKMVEKGKAPKSVERVDGVTGYGSPGEMPHIHFRDGTSINMDGTVHDKKNGAPKLDNETKKWLQENGWMTGD